jgi:tRNA pseudouridine38-40 synthase
MRLALGIEYDGSAFCGWQSQPGVRTIQPCVEAALSRVAARPVRVSCAGRTDTAVHAVGQVIHFDTEAVRDTRAWLLGANANLPRDVGVVWAHEVRDDFDARFSAIARRYCYVIVNRTTRPALWAGKQSWECRALDATAMAVAARHLIGEHDFTSFRAAGCQARHAVRTILHLDVVRHGDWILVDVEANAFLQHMVRNVVGVLLAVGRGERPTEWVAEVLQARDRTHAAATAPPDGLYFVGARYPTYFHVPDPPLQLALPLRI